MTEGWPDSYRDWEGTVDDLAETVDRLLPLVGLPADTTPNARLLRHYVTVGAVSRPERRGKGAFFGFRNLVEALATRVLLQDGWPLAKIADLAATTSTDDLLALLPTAPGPAQGKATPAGGWPVPAADAPCLAEQPPSPGPARAQAAGNRALDLVASFLGRAGSARSSRASEPQAPAPANTPAGTPARSPAPTGPTPPAATPAAPAPSPSTVQRLSQATRDRVALGSDLHALGNPAGAPVRQAVLRITLSSWCAVEVDPDALQSLPPGHADRVADALRRVLVEEIRKRGGRS